jgi:predicted ArsR family transcriptional regulator
MVDPHAATVTQERVLDELLRAGPATAGELVEELCASASAIRARLFDLVDGGLVFAAPRKGGGGSVYAVTALGREASQVPGLRT